MGASKRVSTGNCSRSPTFINGTDFRIVKMVGNQSEVTLVLWVRYANNYKWATADHKIAIFMDPDETAQNVYLNTRGMAGDPKHTRTVLASTPVDAVFSDATPGHTMTTDIWYRIRVHVVAGPHGKMEAWLMPDGQPEFKLNLVHEAGQPANVDDLPTGAIVGFKLDTTYNAGSFITEPMYQWYDEVALYAGLVGGSS